MLDSTGSLSCSLASGFLKRSCLLSKDDEEEGRDGSRGLLQMHLLMTDRVQEQARPMTAPEPHGMTSLEWAGFSAGVDEA